MLTVLSYIALGVAGAVSALALTAGAAALDLPTTTISLPTISTSVTVSTPVTTVVPTVSVSVPTASVSVPTVPAPAQTPTVTVPKAPPPSTTPAVPVPQAPSAPSTPIGGGEQGGSAPSPGAPSGGSGSAGGAVTGPGSSPGSSASSFPIRGTSLLPFGARRLQALFPLRSPALLAGARPGGGLVAASSPLLLELPRGGVLGAQSEMKDGGGGVLDGGRRAVATAGRLLVETARMPWAWILAISVAVLAAISLGFLELPPRALRVLPVSMRASAHEAQALGAIVAATTALVLVAILLLSGAA